MNTKVNVAILGASGYGAGELLRLLTQHPAVKVVCAVSSSKAGVAVEALHPHLAGFYPNLVTSAKADLEALRAAEHGVLISALPNGASGQALEETWAHFDAEERGRLRFIDLSGDLRLDDAGLHQRFYAESPLAERLRETRVYGLPEISREAIRGARFVANPGCLASASILAAAPLAKDHRGSIVIDAKTGSSGSGRELKETTHHPTRHGDFRAYKPLAHQHEPEILQAWSDPHGERIALSFVAQSMDTTRGIFVTVHLTIEEAVSADALRQRYAEFYSASPFVRIRRESPTLQDVVGSNFCDIAVAARGRQVIAMAALDNLVKGMAGTAIQNMNLMCGLPETMGLWMPAVRPV